MPAHRQRGAAMVEFVVVGPVLTLLGLAVLQYSLLYVARNQVNHAGFMAARAGSMHNATPQSISNAYVRNLVPMYGGGRDAEEIAGSLARATADMQGNYRIELPADVLFDFDKSTLKTDGLDELDDFIEEARQAHEDGQHIASITISGYTDQLGSDGVNQRLSLERAEAVRDYMKKNGFPDVPVAVRGMGAADPKVPIESCTGSVQEQMACLAPNRRVLIEIKRTESQQ
jgi:outer membrane protein OmpA-like peptidoglycan-associated protein